MDDTQKQIDGWVKDNPVILFMKGTPQFPMCGFSARVVDILKSTEVAFQAVNVLADPRVREGIKVYGNWPTIPQLYVKGELVGGCDITMLRPATGERAPLLQGASTDGESSPAE